MTTLIQQKSGNDCVLAAIAMAAGKATWEDLWTDEDLEAVKKSRGISELEPWLARAGLTTSDYFEVYVHSSSEGVVKALLWKRRALLSVNSLNNSGGSHMVYWDGTKLWDPHEGHYPTHIAFRHLSSCSISRAYLFAD